MSYPTGSESIPSEPEGNETEPIISFSTANTSVATLSSPWQFDDLQPHCTSCRIEFNPLIRRHHCRMCGKIFCGSCSNQRALIPPSSIVLTPSGGKKAKPRSALHDSISYTPDDDPDRMLTYISQHNKELLYGKGLEERFKLAREPLRVCRACFLQLQPLQEELRNSNSNAMRFNPIDPSDPRRLFNSPIAFTLGHEIRKAAYTLNNLLPMPKRMGALLTAEYNPHQETVQQCKETCSSVSPNLGDLDGVRIPARLLEQARGIAVLTVVKGGFGLAGVELGTGLVVARVEGGRWSAPSAIGTAGLSWGALLGAQVSDHVFLLMTDAAVEMLFANQGSVQLGVDVGVAVGPLGRALEADLGATVGSVAPIYTYSLSKGFYIGISLDGKVIATRDNVNEKFYGRRVSGREILHGAVPIPPAAQPLYEALQRCRVYTNGLGHGHRHSRTEGYDHQEQQQPQMLAPDSYLSEYGEVPPGVPLPPSPIDGHSFMSDLTSSEVYH